MNVSSAQGTVEGPWPNSTSLAPNSRATEAAWDRARNQALARGVPVFYRNDRTGLEIMEQPDGRRFEIRFIPGAPRGRNFEIIRELARIAA